MDTNDFLGSFAQENVSFTTQVIRTTSVGDNYWKTMIFIEDDRFVDNSTTDWVSVPGVTGAKALSVNADTYVGYMSVLSSGVNILQGWLSDLFVNGNIYDCILVTCGSMSGTDAVTRFTSTMAKAYEALKAYAYHKTVCACPTEDEAPMTDVLPALAVSLAQLCAADTRILSSVPYLPYTTTTPSQSDTDTVYTALKNAGADAFMSAYQDSSRNGALYSLGLALAETNGSGTPVGNSFDMIASGNIQSSGPQGAGLSKGDRSYLDSINVQSFKPVGDNSGNCAAVGAKTLKGETLSAQWILAYITYMVKVRVARLITSRNFVKNNANYSRIVTAMSGTVQLFGPQGSGRLQDVVITAPAYNALPEAKEDEIVIQNAWTGRYVDNIRNVRITGALYIGS